MDGWDPIKNTKLLSEGTASRLVVGKYCISSSQVIFFSAPVTAYHIGLLHQEQLSDESETLEVEADLAVPTETEV